MIFLKPLSNFANTETPKDWLFLPKNYLLDQYRLAPSKNPIKEWLDRKLGECVEETYSFFLGKEGLCKLDWEALDQLLLELKEAGFSLDQISKHYREHPPSKMSLKDLHERREQLRQDILIIDRIESVVASLSYHSHLLLSPDEETTLKERIAANSRKCEISNVSASIDLNTWGQLIRILSEIKFTEAVLNLTSRLNLSYESRIQSFSEGYNPAKGDIELQVQSLSNKIAELRTMIEKDDLVTLKSWQSLPEFVKKSLQPKLSSEILEAFGLLESKCRTVCGLFPDAKEFEGPLVRLTEFQEEQKRLLSALKEKWKNSTSMSLDENLSTFFLHGLEHYELLWHSRILSEDQRIRKESEKKFEFLRSVLAHASSSLLKSDDAVIQLAQSLIQKKPLKIKKLKTLEERLIRLNSNSVIRSELGRLKEKAMQKWKSSFESRDLIAQDFTEETYGKVVDLAKRMNSLRYLIENSDEKTESSNLISVSRVIPTELSSHSMERLMLGEHKLGAYPGKNFRAD